MKCCSHAVIFCSNIPSTYDARYNHIYYICPKHLLVLVYYQTTNVPETDILIGLSLKLPVATRIWVGRNRLNALYGTNF